MANEITSINGVTKVRRGAEDNYSYDFPRARFEITNNADPNEGFYKHFLLNGLEVRTVKFSEITDKLGATDIEGYVDELANLGFFFDIGQGGTPVETLDNRIIVKQESDFGTIQSDKEYFLDGIIQVTGNGVVIPDGVKLNLKSYNFNLGGIVNIDVNGRCVTGASVGDILVTDCSFSATNGVAIEVTADTGNEAIEYNRVNFNGCADASMILTDFRQLLIDGCGFFGGQPNIELRGLMDGARITTTIVRGISNTTTFFKAGAGFEMFGSFLTDLNIDLSTSGVLCDFTEANFTDVDIIPNVLRFKGARVFRNGDINTDSSSAVPNISDSSLASFWADNEGLNNTSIGGRVFINTPVTTVITATSTPTDLAGVYSSNELVHMSATVTGRLRNLDQNQREYLAFIGGKLETGQNNQLKVYLYAFRDATSTEEEILMVDTTVDRLQGARDVADANLIGRIRLNSQDEAFIKVSNETNTNNITGENSIYLLLVKI